MSSRRSPSLLEFCTDQLQCMLGVSASSSSFSSSPLPPSLSILDHGLLATSARDAPSSSNGSNVNVQSRNMQEKSERTSESALEIALSMILNVVVVGLLTTAIHAGFQKLFGSSQEEDSPKPVSSTRGRLYQILLKRSSGDSSQVLIPHLTSHEYQMAEEIIDPKDIESSFHDIGGLDDTKREIYELAIMPLVQPELFKSKLAQPVKGILLYGRPGTGKTMLAKALAKEAQAVFLPLQLSKILNKWVGESNKLIAAAFSLAHKLQPSIIFIDELDTFLKANNQETAYLDSIKAEFLTLWDGIATANSSRVLVLGATNKPQTIDSAILRRMPRAFHVPLPNRHGRLAILKLLIEGESVEPDVTDYLPQLALKTSGYSGSDLKELCKAAAMVGIQELTKEFSRRRVNGEDVKPSDCIVTPGTPKGILKNGAKKATPPTGAATIASKPKIRPISIQDLETALDKVKKTGEDAHTYGDRDARPAESTRSVSSVVNEDELRRFFAIFQSLSALSVTSNGGGGYGSNNDDIPSVVLGPNSD